MPEPWIEIRGLKTGAMVLESNRQGKSGVFKTFKARLAETGAPGDHDVHPKGAHRVRSIA